MYFLELCDVAYVMAFPSDRELLVALATSMLSREFIAKLEN